jgi:hypothetical protein
VRDDVAEGDEQEGRPCIGQDGRDRRLPRFSPRSSAQIARSGVILRPAVVASEGARATVSGGAQEGSRGPLFTECQLGWRFTCGAVNPLQGSAFGLDGPL